MFTKWLKVNDWKRTESYTVGLQQYSSTMTMIGKASKNTLRMQYTTVTELIHNDCFKKMMPQFLSNYFPYLHE